MKSRWLSKPTTTTRQEKRGSMGSMVHDDLSSKESFCLSPNGFGSINGIPAWENPMETTLNSVSKHDTSPPVGRNKPPTSAVRGRVSVSETVANIQSSPRKQTINPLTSSGFPTRMVIECDDGCSHSEGELTIDESFAYDERYGRPDQDFHSPVEARNSERATSAPYHLPPHPPNRTRSMHIQPSQHRHQSAVSTSTTTPISPVVSVEDEEMRQLELAMERSLQDYGSCASYGNASMTSDRSHGSRFGVSSTTESKNKNLPSSGCHLSMVSSSSLSHRGQTTSSKHDAKHWRKPPINHGIDGLLAIVEENDANINKSIRHLDSQQSYQSNNSSDCRSPSKRTYSTIDPDLAIARLQELEREKQLLEMVLKQSAGMNHDDCHERHCHREPSSSVQRPTMASYRSVHSMDSDELFLGGDGSQQRPPIRRGVQKTVSVRSSDFDAAGCHLQMYAARSKSTRNLNMEASSSSSSNNNNNNNSNNMNYASISSLNTKMIWKRGPNGAWGRFPDDENVYQMEDDDDNDDGGAAAAAPVEEEDEEEAQMAEALRRSMQQM